jgi:Ca2+-binding RTX toxin-like protein
VTGTSANNTLAGTAAEDFLIGSDGDDLIYAGPGDDGINGGAGEDVAMFRGNRSAYSVSPEGDGYRVIGSDGSDYVYAVEMLYFQDGTRIYLD